MGTSGQAVERADSTQGVDTRSVTRASDRERGAVGLDVGATGSRYHVLEEIGRGGMGRVVRAYDPELDREVALKQVRAAELDEELTLRLVAEARAMARLSHPNVVAVYDVETVDGQVVLVMELVVGESLARWLSRATRDRRHIVRYFVQAGRGLAAAHEAGLLHRDFKPANVLVTGPSRAGDDAVVKVTDFGLAKSLVDDGAGDSGISTASSEIGLTKYGTVVGTPRYMAPEQYVGGALTEATDQYAFCVALWEALCGAPPFFGCDLEPKKRAGPPAWPATGVPRRVVRAIRRGLSPEPNARWRSMAALLAALSDDPGRRWTRGLIATTALAVAGTAAWAWGGTDAPRCSGAQTQLAGTWDDDVRARVEAAMSEAGPGYAARVWTRTEGVLDRYRDQWSEMYRDTCEATTVRGEQSARVMDLRMACLQRANQQLRAATEVLAAADADVVQRAHEVVADLPPVSQCADVEALEAGVAPPPPGEADAVATGRALLARAAAERAAGRYDAAGDRVADAEATLQTVTYAPVLAELAIAQGDVHDVRGRYAAAEEAWTRALQHATDLGDYGIVQQAATNLLAVVGAKQTRIDEALDRYRLLALRLAGDDARAEGTARTNLATVLAAQGKLDAAEAEHRRALALGERAFGADDPDVARVRNNLGNVLRAQGKYADAEAQHRAALTVWEAALGAEHPVVAASQDNLASTLYAQARHAEAEAGHRRALAIRERALGAAHPDVAASHNNLAAVLLAQGKYAEAETSFRRALGIWEETLGVEHTDVAYGHNNVAITSHLQGEYGRAESAFRHAIEVWERALGPEHPHVARARGNLAGTLQAQGNSDDAEREYRRALSLTERALGAEHPDVAETRHNLAVLLAQTGRLHEAEVEQRHALAAWEHALGPDHPLAATASHALADVLAARGRTDEARALAERAWSSRRADDLPTEHRAETAFLLARLTWTTTPTPDARGRALELATLALKEFERSGEVHRADADSTRAWLDARR